MPPAIYMAMAAEPRGGGSAMRRLAHFDGSRAAFEKAAAGLRAVQGAARAMHPLRRQASAQADAHAVPGSLPDDARRPGCGPTQYGGNRSAAEMAGRQAARRVGAAQHNLGEVQDETETWLEQVLDATDIWIKRHHGAEAKAKAP